MGFTSQLKMHLGNTYMTMKCRRNLSIVLFKWSVILCRWHPLLFIRTALCSRRLCASHCRSIWQKLFMHRVGSSNLETFSMKFYVGSPTAPQWSDSSIHDFMNTVLKKILLKLFDLIYRLESTTAKWHCIVYIINFDENHWYKIPISAV